MNEWYYIKIKEIYKFEIWMVVVKLLFEEGFLMKMEILVIDGYKFVIIEFIDNMFYDGKKFVEYIKGFKIGIKDQLYIVKYFYFFFWDKKSF